MQLQLLWKKRKKFNGTSTLASNREPWMRGSGSGSAWIRIDSALMDPDPQWQNGSGWKDKKNLLFNKRQDHQDRNLKRRGRKYVNYCFQCESKWIGVWIRIPTEVSSSIRNGIRIQNTTWMLELHLLLSLDLVNLSLEPTETWAKYITVHCNLAF